MFAQNPTAITRLEISTMTPTKPKQRHRALLRATLVGIAALLSLQAQAALVTSRAALGGNDFVDWGQLGPSGKIGRASCRERVLASV